MIAAERLSARCRGGICQPPPGRRGVGSAAPPRAGGRGAPPARAARTACPVRRVDPVERLAAGVALGVVAVERVIGGGRAVVVDHLIGAVEERLAVLRARAAPGGLGAAVAVDGEVDLLRRALLNGGLGDESEQGDGA